MKKEAILDFVAQICELTDAFKKCKDKLCREILQKEEAEPNCIRQEYELRDASRRIETPRI